jgi:general secretion pathway protein K
MMSFRAQRGVALLTILLMVVMATILASSLLMRQQRIVRETAVLTRQNQAMQYALGGESFLMALLSADEKTSGETDTLQEVWAKPSPPYPVEDGMVMGRLTDQSGKFNLNNLYHDGAADEKAIELFKRLLDQVGLPPELSDAVLDWQDPDDTVTGSSGAEDSFYLGMQPSRLAANRPFNSIEELKQVRGFEDPESFEALRKYVCALPAFAPINVNTADLPVLSAIAPDLDVPTVNDWRNERDGQRKPVGDIGKFWQLAAFSKVDEKLRVDLTPFLSVKSQYYQAQIKVMLSERYRFLTSDIYRQGDQASVYQRSWAPFPPELKEP